MAVFSVLLLIASFIGGQIAQYINYVKGEKILLLDILLQWMNLSSGMSVFILVVTTIITIVALWFACLYVYEEVRGVVDWLDALDILLSMILFCGALIFVPSISWLLILISCISFAKFAGNAIVNIIGICCVALAVWGTNGSNLPITSQSCEHTTFEWIVSEKATCIAMGKKQQQCVECGSVLCEENLEIDSQEHTMGEWSVSLAATCETQGLKYQECVDCKIKIVEKIQTHPNRIQIPAKAATCLESGITEGYKCQDCNQIIDGGITLAALGHNWLERKKIEPTCNEYGWTYGIYCERCNMWDIQSTKIEKLSHEEVYESAVEPTCTEEGYTEYSYCSVCNTMFNEKEIIAPLGHDFEIRTNTCTRCPEKEFFEVKTLNGWDEIPDGTVEVVIYLDYAIDTTKTYEQLILLSATDKYIRLIGTSGKEYAVRIEVPSNSVGIVRIDLVDTILYTKDSPVKCDSKADIQLGFYGNQCGVKCKTGENGNFGDQEGENGAAAIKVKGDLMLVIAADMCFAYGGNGGKGYGDGILYGKDGGNGGLGISASSIRVKVLDGYDADDLYVIGGKGGNGGKSLYGVGNKGADGEATNVPIQYE